ncbi:MAG: energy transducer TonB [Silvibacterium sp.]
MISLRGIICCFLICLPLAAQDVPSPQDMVNNLKGKVVLLRGMEAGDKLDFDAQGIEIGTVPPGSFPYSAVKIEKVRRSDAELKITGERVALVLVTASNPPSMKDLHLILLGEPVSVTIALDAAHPESLDAAIHTVFAFSLRDALLGKSNEEVNAALESIASSGPENGDVKSSPPTSGAAPPKIYKPGTGVSRPVLIHSVDPAFPPDLVKDRPFKGVSVLSLIVDTSGRPTHVRVVHALSHDADLSAIEAVSQYRFTPALYQGKPVPVMIHVEVNFSVY